MADLATLGVVVTTKGVNEAKRGLDGLSASGAKAEKEVGKIAPTFDKAAISAKQLANAQRQLPAQFTDIATGLATGQRPLQVLLQQGGQLKDIFGGVGPALQATVGYVVGLINPVTLLAAAVIGLAVAWRQGEQEGVAFNKALIQTGNAAGTTAEALALAADRIGDVVGTQRSASQALVQVAQTGRFTAEQIELIALAAEKARVATGKAVEDTVAEFVKLEGDPVKAIIALNRAQNFLEADQLRQIRTLQQQGREFDAQALAFDLYARTTIERSGQIEQSLGSLDRAWRSVKGAVLDYIDAARDIGRTDPASQLQQLDRQIEGLEGGQGLPLALRPLTFAATPLLEKLKRDRAQLAREIEESATQAAAEAAKEGARARANEAAIAIQEEAQAFVTAEEKRAQQIIAARTKADQAIEQARAAGREDLVAGIEADTQKIIAGINRPAEEAAAREAEAAARKAAAEAQRLSAQSARERERILRDGIKAEEALNEVINRNAADLAGPAAQAAREYADELLRLTGEQEKLAAAGLLNETTERNLAIAREQANESYQERLRVIEETKTQAEQFIEDLEFELRLMTLSNAEREEEIALRYLGADATEEQREAVKRLNAEYLRMREAIQAQDDFRASFEDSVASVLDGSKSIGDAFRDFVDEIISQLSRIVARNFTESLFGSFGQQGGGRFGDGLSSLFGSFFGGGRAAGGLVKGGKAYPVNERGQPEVLEMYGRKYLLPGGDGEVTPLREGAGGQASIVNQVIQVTGTVDRRSAYQIQREAQMRQNLAVSR